MSSIPSWSSLPSSSTFGLDRVGSNPMSSLNSRFSSSLNVSNPTPMDLESDAKASVSTSSLDQGMFSSSIGDSASTESAPIPFVHPNKPAFILPEELPAPLSSSSSSSLPSTYSQSPSPEASKKKKHQWKVLPVTVNGALPVPKFPSYNLSKAPFDIRNIFDYLTQHNKPFPKNPAAALATLTHLQEQESTLLGEGEQGIKELDAQIKQTEEQLKLSKAGKKPESSLMMDDEQEIEESSLQREQMEEQLKRAKAEKEQVMQLQEQRKSALLAIEKCMHYVRLAADPSKLSDVVNATLKFFHIGHYKEDVGFLPIDEILPKIYGVKKTATKFEISLDLSDVYQAIIRNKPVGMSLDTLLVKYKHALLSALDDVRKKTGLGLDVTELTMADSGHHLVIFLPSISPEKRITSFFPNLKTVNMGTNGTESLTPDLQKEDWKWLAKLQNLEVLNLRGCSSASLAHLIQLLEKDQKLRAAAGGVGGGGGGGWPNVAQPVPASFSNLRQLDLLSSNFTDKDVQKAVTAISHLPKLEMLRLTHKVKNIIMKK